MSFPPSKQLFLLLVFFLLVIFSVSFQNEYFLSPQTFVLCTQYCPTFYQTRVRSLQLVTLVTHWHDMSVPFNRLDWCDPSQLKTCWGCYCCWCWCWETCSDKMPKQLRWTKCQMTTKKSGLNAKISFFNLAAGILSCHRCAFGNVYSMISLPV